VSDMPLSRAQRRLMLRPVMQTHKEVISHKEMVSGRVNVQILTQSRQLALQSVPWASDRLETYSCWLFVADNGDDYGSKKKYWNKGVQSDPKGGHIKCSPLLDTKYNSR
jgi:hypothetical protein